MVTELPIQIQIPRSLYCTKSKSKKGILQQGHTPGEYKHRIHKTRCINCQTPLYYEPTIGAHLSLYTIQEEKELW